MTTFHGPPASSEPGIGALTLPGFLAEVATRHAGRDALVFDDAAGTIRWSYAELELQARRVAGALVASGVARGDRVAVLMGNRPEWVASAFGTAIAGGVFVPVNTFLEPPELEYVLEHSESRVLLMQERLLAHDYRSAVDEMRPRLGGLRVVATLDDWDGFLSSGEAAPTRAVEPDDDAMIIYTSGTTARPKGVLHAHRAPSLQSWRFVRHLCLHETARAWSAFPMFWTAGFAMFMGATLAVGGCLVLQETFEPGEALRLLERERVTTPHGWPHQLAALEEHPLWAGADLSAVRHIESFGPFGRHPTISVPVDSYSPRAAFGLTETFTIITSEPADTPAAIRDRAQGRILPGNALRILHPDSGEPMSDGEEGEIAVAGPTLMKGYVKLPPSAAFDAEGFFRTGDAGWVDDDGFLHWTGRTSDLIKTGGANVSPVEIEMELLRHPALKAAGAVGVPHPTLGQIVVVVAVAHEGSPVDEQDVRGFLRGRIASYKIPRRVVFVGEEELSLTGNAKIRPEDLRALAATRLDAPPG
jgi:fatty-acyl-CoA synthase